MSWYLGKIKDTNERVYLRDFTWDCGWYWGGGYIGNNNLHCHFKGAFLDEIDIRGHVFGNRWVTPWTQVEQRPSNAIEVKQGCSIWEDAETFLDDVPHHVSSNWWRIKDLFKQFYVLQDAAEVFRYGGHCTSSERKPDEINLEMAKSINQHIETVIIREIRNIFNEV